MVLTVLGLVLFIGGAAAGGAFAGITARESGLLDIEPAWIVPASIGGLAVGMLPGLLLMAVNNQSSWSVRKVILAAAGATTLGAVIYAAFAGGLIWLAGLVFPNGLTTFVAVVVSIVGLPVAGPIAYQLISGRRADELPGGRPLPKPVYRVRRSRDSDRPAP